jgi:hypothetical protein
VNFMEFPSAEKAHEDRQLVPIFPMRGAHPTTQKASSQMAKRVDSESASRPEPSIGSW